MDGSAQDRHASATQTNVAHGAAIINAVQGGNQYVYAAPPTAAVQRLAEAADRLARAVHAQWTAEEGRRRVHDPLPLPVRWINADEHLVDHWPNIRRAAAGDGQEPLDLGGRLSQVVDVYRRVPSGRLVVLGPAGSGKTILGIRLVLDLLEGRHDDVPVPVIVDLGGWDPARASTGEWIVQQLSLTYPGLPAPAALLDAGMILPILDGFDEIAAGMHPAALARLSDTTMPLLLTSRPQEYAAAVDAGDVLTAAAVIVLKDLTAEDLVAYLPRSTRKTNVAGPATTKWDPVLDAVNHPDARPEATAVRETLSTPLMVSLARTVYSDDRAADPAELLDAARFPARADIEAHLLDAFLRSAFQHGPPRWPAESVDRWLTHLAIHLHTLGSRDLAWWQLRDTVPRRTRLIAGVLIAVPPCLAVFGTLHAIGQDLTSALLLGCGVGVAVGLIVGLPTVGPQPSRTQWHRLRQWRRLRQPESLMRWCLFGFAVGLLVLLEESSGVGLSAGLGVGVVVGLSFGSPPGKSALRPLPGPSRIGRHVRWAVAGLVTGLVYWAISVGATVASRDLVPVEEYPHDLTAGLWSGAGVGVWHGIVFGALCGLGSVVAASTAPELGRGFSRRVGLAVAAGVVFTALTGTEVWLTYGGNGQLEGFRVLRWSLWHGLQAALGAARYWVWAALLIGIVSVLVSGTARPLPVHSRIREMARPFWRCLLVGVPLGLALGLCSVLGLWLGDDVEAGVAIGALAALIVSVSVGLLPEIQRTRERSRAARVEQVLRALTVAVATAIVAELLLEPVFRSPAALVGGLVAGTAAGVWIGLAAPARPERSTWHRWRWPLLGAVVALAVRLSPAEPPEGLAWGAVIVFPLGVIIALTRRVPGEFTRTLSFRPRRQWLDRRLFVNAASGFVVGVVFGIADTVDYVAGWQGFHREHPDLDYPDVELATELLKHLPAYLGAGVLGALAFAVLSLITTAASVPVDLETAISPGQVLRADRRGTIVRITVLGLLIMVPELPGAFDDGVRYGIELLMSDLEIGLLLGLALGLANAWIGWLIIARVYLPLAGRLPWALPRFLADAHDRGVLRQSGAVYQFRHARLQDRLVDRP